MNNSKSGLLPELGAVGNLVLATAIVTLSLLLAPAIASQSDNTGKPLKPDDEAQKQARHWVKSLEIDNRRAEAANALLRMGAKAVPALLQALDDPRPVVVQRVAPILRALGSQAASAKERLLALSNSENRRLAEAARYAIAGIQPAGITLVVDCKEHNVLELDKTGKVLRTLTGVNRPWVKGPWDAERLPNGNLLICSVIAKKVVEWTATGKMVWSFSKLKRPYKAQRLLNGNTLIADGGSGVFEVDRAGKTVWKYDKDGVQAFDTERLVTGNTLIVDNFKKRVIEVSSKGAVVWEHKHGQDAYDADRLRNGNTLITIYEPGKVIEVTPKGNVVHELKGLNRPCDADRLANLHTLVAQRGEVSEYDAKGNKIWSTKATFPAEVTGYGIMLAPPIASKSGTTGKLDDEAQKLARRWVTFLELDNRQAKAANGLLKMGPDAVPALVQALNDPRPVVAQRVCHILRTLGPQALAAKEMLVALAKSEDPKLAEPARYALFGVQHTGITLVADPVAHKVVELDRTGKVVLTLTGATTPMDAERLPNGNYLICDGHHKKVVEMTAKGDVVWSFARLKNPFKAQWLPNGSTLIADLVVGVVEVDRAGKIVWKYAKGGIKPLDAERLVTGNTLIADDLKKRVIEVTPQGEIVWKYRHGRRVWDVDRLPNGNTLVVHDGPGKIIEVTPKGEVVHEMISRNSPYDADRLPNGHTLVARVGRVSEYDAHGKQIWSITMARPHEVNRY